MTHIEVDEKHIDGAWLIRKAEEMGITIPSKPASPISTYGQAQDMGSIVADIERYFNPLSPSRISSHRGKSGPGIIYLKKAIRRVLKPVFSALINTQGIFNGKILEWVRLQHQWDKRTERRVAALDKAAREMNRRLLKLEKASQLDEISTPPNPDQREDAS